MPFAADVAALVTPPHALVAPAQQTAWTTVTVRSGDTLWALALKHRTSTEAIVTKNRLARGGAVIHVGQKLLVPTPAAAQPAPGTSATTAKPGTAPPKKPTTAPRVHVVRSGDTMSGIAARYRTSLGTLLAANQLRASSYIFVGQRITIPGPGVIAKPAPTAKPVPKPASTPPSTTRAASVAASKAKLAAMSVPSRTETADLIRSIATRHGVDPKLAQAIGWLESGWHQRAVSSTNAVGVMQIMPITGTWASQLAGRTLDLYDVRDNITAGVLVLRALQNMAESKDQAIAAYYQGLYSVRTRGLFTDTKAYVASVKAIYARL
jgi:N-acetylmuramoyl-L-alanine amidase